MSITLDPSRPSPDQISALRSGRSATPEGKAVREAAKVQEPQDKIAELIRQAKAEAGVVE